MAHGRVLCVFSFGIISGFSLLLNGSAYKFWCENSIRSRRMA